jgi:hypothetical protein
MQPDNITPAASSNPSLSFQDDISRFHCGTACDANVASSVPGRITILESRAISSS